MNFRKLAFALIVTSALAWGALANARKAGRSTVIIEGMKFTPQELTVKKGESITWENHDLVPHTVTSTDAPFDSKTIPPGKSWTFRARKSGKYSYSCVFHPVMSGSISIQ